MPLVCGAIASPLSFGAGFCTAVDGSEDDRTAS